MLVLNIYWYPAVAPPKMQRGLNTFCGKHEFFHKFRLNINDVIGRLKQAAL